MKLSKIALACCLSTAAVPTLFAQDISGVVKNAQGEVIANANVAIVNSKQVTKTDQNGRFIFTDLTAGKFELHVTASSYSHKNQQVIVAEDNVENIEFLLHPSAMEVIDVTATPLHSSTIESALPVNVIAADELRTKQASTLGETLKNEVGVHSTYFGPVASSPIIRGMDGPRVLITQNGLDVGDASRVGPDHVVSSETATAQQIEVLRGPSTLFYGSGAIGGVVNVVDNRVPTSLENNLDVMLKHSDVASEDEASFALNRSVGQLAFHLDGFWRDGDDYKIPGFAESHDAHDDEHEEHDENEDHEEHDEELGAYGYLPNSAAKSSGFTFGTSYIIDNGYLGFSFGSMSRTYGVPGHNHGHDEHEAIEGHELEGEAHEEGGVFGKLDQDRFQLLSELTFDQSFINKVASKVSYTDYQHREIEEDVVGTTFSNEMLEARFDVYHQAFDGWKGAWTLHYKTSEFAAEGEEAFTPASDTDTLAFAWLEEKHLSEDLLVQLGARVEHVNIDILDSGELNDEHEHEEGHHDEEEHHFESQSFTPISLSLGAVWEYQHGYNLGLSLSYSERAPSAGELFANGPHIGTNSFEVGALYEAHVEGDEVHFDLIDRDIELEAATNLDLTWRKYEGNFGFVVGAFYNQIDNYFYQANTGLFAEDAHAHDEEEHVEEGIEEEQGLPVYIYQQGDVDMYGIEAELVYRWDNGFKATVFTDFIKADLQGGENLPRIPPMRLGGQLEYQAANYSAQLSVTHYFEQDETAALESETEGYTLVDINANYYLDGIGNDFVIFAKVNNLTDEEARVHTSFLKNVAPLPARGIELGVRASF